jgi:hypothetical protein
MLKGMSQARKREILSFAYWLSYGAVLLFAVVVPFFLYCASSFENYRLASRKWVDTEFVALGWLTPSIIVLLFLAMAVPAFYMPTLGIIFRKLAMSAKGGRGLIIPLAVSGLVFYGPILALILWNDVGSLNKDKQFLVATPLIQSSYSVYLVVLSVTVLIRYWFITASVQTGIYGFIRNLTVELKRLGRSQGGRLTISLPWLCFGQLSLDPDLFDEFRQALEKCLAHENIDLEIYTLHPDEIRLGAKASIEEPTSIIDMTGIEEFLKCEVAARLLAERRTQIKTHKQADLVPCVIVNEKLYAVHWLPDRAKKYGHLADVILSMEINDEGICAEYKRRLMLIPSAVSS